jgi:hypothetical protein
MYQILPALLLMTSVLAHADTRVQVLESDPGSPATLGHWERFHLRIAYEADRPIRVRADAYHGNDRVTEMTSGSPRYEPGQGEALFWFAWTRPQRVSHIMVWAEEEQGKAIARADFPVELTSTGQRTTSQRARPEWVTLMLAERDRRTREEFQERMNRPAPWWESVLFTLVMWSIPLYFIVQIVVLLRWRGGWRKAAGIPAALMLLVLGHAIFALFAGSNLFPLGLIFTAPLALLYLLVLMVLKRSPRVVT